jgi:vacuolar protein sorting-associated protein 33A
MQGLSTDESGSSIPTGLSAQSEQIDALIVLDRGVDMITPLLTQLTYEGLVDELIGIKNGVLCFSNIV